MQPGTRFVIFRCCIGALRVSAAIALLASPARAETADAVVAAMLPCTSDFFATLSAQKAVFGLIKVTAFSHPERKPDNAVGSRLQGSIVTFANPVEAQGLQLTGYVQAALENNGKPGTFWWGFRVEESPARIESWVRSRTKDADFRKRGDSYGWVQELDPDWRRTDETLIESRLPLRMLLVEPSKDTKYSGSTLRCAVHHGQMGAVRTLPDISDLFMRSP
jgi:hypothetical protein